MIVPTRARNCCCRRHRLSEAAGPARAATADWRARPMGWRPAADERESPIDWPLVAVGRARSTGWLLVAVGPVCPSRPLRHRPQARSSHRAAASVGPSYPVQPLLAADSRRPALPVAEAPGVASHYCRLVLPL